MTATSQNILFIDTNVADYTQLISQISGDMEVVILDKQRDALTQMAEVLRDKKDLASIHIISHGTPGELAFASGVFNTDNLQSYSRQLAAMGKSLTANGDILLYGCNVGQGDIGGVFIRELAQLTGADVAASTDVTGDIQHQGNWLLEYQQGQIETPTFASEDYAHSLGATPSVFDVANNPLAFQNPTDIVAGINVNASKLYSNVRTIDGQQIDAIVTLTGLTNATLTTFDSTTNPYSDAAYFQPNLNIGTAGGYATFTVKFILGGSYNASSNPTGTPVTLRNVLANTYDLDGAGASANGRQFTDFSDIGGYTLSTTTKVGASDLGNGVTRFLTTVGGNITGAPGTTTPASGQTVTGDEIRARVSFAEVSQTTINVGDNGATGTAYYGIDFSAGAVFTNARTAGITIAGGPVSTNESGTTGQFTVVLTAQPTADVTITFSGLDSTEGSLGLGCRNTAILVIF